MDQPFDLNQGEMVHTNRLTFSVCNKSVIDLPSRYGPGNTNLAPVIVAAYGIPHALA
jgi:hypothetical protein